MTEYYKLQRITIPPPGEDRLATAAFIDCELCGAVISSSGGPGHGAICITCGDAIMRGDAPQSTSVRGTSDAEI